MTCVVIIDQKLYVLFLLNRLHPLLVLFVKNHLQLLKQTVLLCLERLQVVLESLNLQRNNYGSLWPDILRVN